MSIPPPVSQSILHPERNEDSQSGSQYKGNTCKRKHDNYKMFVEKYIQYEVEEYIKYII